MNAAIDRLGEERRPLRLWQMSDSRFDLAFRAGAHDSNRNAKRMRRRLHLLHCKTCIRVGRVPQHANEGSLRHQIVEQFKPLLCRLPNWRSLSHCFPADEPPPSHPGILSLLKGAYRGKYEGTVERFTGDGLLVVFNDPVPCPDPCLRAVHVAVEMRDEVAKLCQRWSRLGHDLGFGIGVAYGYATLGTIGYEGRLQYSVTGKVANLAARLCGEATNGQILVEINVCSAIEAHTDIEFIGELNFRAPRKMPTSVESCESDL
jgi:Adenylate and Guanylate cyclase catalytic domain